MHSRPTRTRICATVRRLSVSLSVCPICRPLQQRVARLLLDARESAILIDSAAARRSAASATSVTFIAAVEGWTQTCIFWFSG